MCMGLLPRELFRPCSHLLVGLAGPSTMFGNRTAPQSAFDAASSDSMRFLASKTAQHQRTASRGPRAWRRWSDPHGPRDSGHTRRHPRLPGRSSPEELICPQRTHELDSLRRSTRQFIRAPFAASNIRRSRRDRAGRGLRTERSQATRWPRLRDVDHGRFAFEFHQRDRGVRSDESRRSRVLLRRSQRGRHVRLYRRLR